MTKNIGILILFWLVVSITILTALNFVAMALGRNPQHNLYRQLHKRLHMSRKQTDAFYIALGACAVLSVPLGIMATKSDEK